MLVYPVIEMDEDREVPDDSSRPNDHGVRACGTDITGSPDKALVRFVVHDKTRADEPIVEAA